ncbi:uncharacterized protein C8Q71DRAFT_706099 [Rhodofomes roseus]|uniref:Aminoglycoside phosphotransferase domain-containing protein n=1 Tax=Rhodofomes roseus TaxID=34475 RepID=A0ABQ8KKQ1_9APHY|nr:uncharacterized protein C8Q71DRAFT_706099 [Rhodofomes roseus]KAH9838073.1 hypothetical protein C8Q71DRAFT_706099 [Rhodofomes roseus]
MQLAGSEDLAAVNVTKEQAQQIIDRHRRGSASVSSIVLHSSSGFSGFTPTKTYHITLADGTAYTLRVSPPPPPAGDSYAPNTLAHEHALLQRLSSNTSLPLPTAYALDTSFDILQFPYLLLSRPSGVPLSRARAQGLLSERQVLLLDLRLGALLHEQHDVQNDWFGTPAQEHDGLYSWQEAFTFLLETLIEDANALGVALAHEKLRKPLGRAIGSFLFDDCEVPSLVSFAGDEDAIVVDVSQDSEASRGADEVPVTSFLTVSHALWGDPLLETLFMDPSKALEEGYGGSLIVFRRQKTKRLWYTVFLALMVLVQAKREEQTGVRRTDSGKVAWARKRIDECIEELQTAPTY